MKLSFLVGALVISEIASAITGELNQRQAAIHVSNVSVSHDPGYDDRSRSLNLVSCSDGQNGLITKHGWQTQGAVPRFPNIGGSQFVTGWNSTNVSCLFLVFNMGLAERKHVSVQD